MIFCGVWGEMSSHFQYLCISESVNSPPIETGSNYMDYEVGYDDDSQYYGYDEGIPV